MEVLRRIWAWVKRYWQYLLFPVGIVVGIISMLSRRTGPISPSPSELDEAEKEKEVIEEEARRQTEEAEKERAAKVEEVKKAHKETIDRLTKEQEEKVGELLSDPQALNDFLLSVDQDLRG